MAYAVAQAETNGGKKGWGKLYNNHHGIRVYNGTKLVPNRYPNAKFENSYDHFKDVWTRMYKTDRPTFAQAKKWTGGDRTQDWFDNVNYYLKS